MKLSKHLRTPLFLFIAFLVLAVLAENYVLNGGIRQQDLKRFTRTLHKKEKLLEQIMVRTGQNLEGVNLNRVGELFASQKANNELFEQKEMTVLVSHGESLLYWSDHVVGFEKEITSSNEGLVQMPNGWFILSRMKYDTVTVHGMFLIKYDYKIENEYLQNKFARGFHLPNDFEVHFYESSNSYPIYDRNNRFLFSIKPSGVLPCIYSDLYIPAALFVFALFFLFMLIYRHITHYLHRYKELKLLLLLLVLIALYSLMNFTGHPRSLYMLNLFSPRHFAYSAYWTSLGEFFTFSLFLFFWGINFIRSFNISKKILKNDTKRRLSLVVWMLLTAFLFEFIHFMIHTLIMNSGISYALYRIEDLSLYSIFGFLSIGFLLLSFFFFAFRTTQVFRKHSGLKEFIIILTGVTLLFVLLVNIINHDNDYRLNLFFWLILLVSFIISQRNIIKHRLSLIVLYTFIFTLFSLFSIVPLVDEHESNVQKLMAMNLSAEHDPTAEIYLRDIDQQIKKDSILTALLQPPYEQVDDYLFRKYFGGYFREYDFQITLCHEDDSVNVQPENYLAPCFRFFDNLISENRVNIPGINFRFLDNLNGRITYFGQYEFFDPLSQQHIHLYIELNSKLLSEGTGFPELLLPAHSFENRLKSNLSFAKYNEGELVDRSGDFLYALTSKAYRLKPGETGFKTWDDYEHYIYAERDNSYIIVSRPQIGFMEYLISFPYIFVYLFLLSVIISYAIRPFVRDSSIKNSLRIRIQVAIIGVVLITLLVVGSGTIFYIMAEYRSNHQQDLVDKIVSISTELDMVMSEVDSLDQDLIDFLNYDLIRISDIFWTDINIYNLEGKLLATSRPEVFEKGLISERMDNTAMYYLSTFQPSRFLHKEHIAGMEYLSAYVPLINRPGDNIGYLNLPYFTKERAFRQKITTFILAFINIYVFLLMASILVAYFISARITDPLKLIRENLRGVQLGKHTQEIDYESDDEIGVLVSEYNNKVKELAQSAELLARSERETAWREMAKQIAHEIKNPLTPMKLNIQFLQRTRNDQSDEYQEKVMRVSETLIEQIDNLSAIATAFSNFAKIPKAKNEKFELISRLKEILKLYNYTGQVKIQTYFDKLNSMYVYADKEQFSRAVINLLKNAIQAVPENQEGHIDIKVLEKNNAAVIKITDNGKGIKQDLKEQIFVPNFTTKSSGAGLGLAITKNIVENFKGRIWFESDGKSGTSFYIEIPFAE